MGSMIGLFAIIMIVGMAGIITSAIIYEMYVGGWVIDEYISGTITIADVMTVMIVTTIIVALIAGAYVYANR